MQEGQQVIITSGSEKTPVAELKAIEPIAQKRLGFLHYLNLNIPDSAFFEDLPEDGLKLWEGDRE